MTVHEGDSGWCMHTHLCERTVSARGGRERVRSPGPLLVKAAHRPPLVQPGEDGDSCPGNGNPASPSLEDGVSIYTLEDVERGSIEASPRKKGRVCREAEQRWKHRSGGRGGGGGT